MKTYNWEGVNPDGYFLDRKSGSAGMPRSEERFSRNAETDIVCRLLLGKKKATNTAGAFWIWTFTPRTVVAAMAGAIWTATRTRAERVKSGGNTTPTSRKTSL